MTHDGVCNLEANQTHCLRSLMSVSIVSPSFRTQSLSLLRNASRIWTSGSVGLEVPLLPSVTLELTLEIASADDVRDAWRMENSAEGEKTMEEAFRGLVVATTSGALTLLAIVVGCVGLDGTVCEDDISAGGAGCIGEAEDCPAESSGFVGDDTEFSGMENII